MRVNKTHQFFQHHRLTFISPHAISCPDRKQDLHSGVASGNRDRVEPQVKVKRTGIAACSSFENLRWLWRVNLLLQ
jgi:hypothetical protein